MSKIITYFTAFLLTPRLMWACQSCFGANVNTATTQGIEVAMLALLGITGFVSTGIVMFFLSMKKRRKHYAQDSVNELDFNHEGSKSETLDQLLDKINESGFQNLTKQETELLEKVSKNQNN